MGNDFVDGLARLGLTGPGLARVMVALGDTRTVAAIQQGLLRATKGMVRPSGEVMALLGALDRLPREDVAALAARSRP